MRSKCWAITDVLHSDLAGARLVAFWALEDVGEAPPPLADEAVDAILALLRGRVG